MSERIVKDDLVIESWEIEKIIPYEKNAKIHNEKQIESLAKIIKERGFRRPITIDEDGVIIAGHGRRLAAIKLGYTHVPVIVERGLTEEQKAADRISDNMVSRGEFDEDLLGEEVMRLAKIEDFDFGLLGMDELEIKSIFDDFGETFPNIQEFDTKPIEIASNDDKPKQNNTNKSVDYKPFYSVIVECKDEDDQKVVHDILAQHNRECKIQTM